MLREVVHYQRKFDNYNWSFANYLEPIIYFLSQFQFSSFMKIISESFDLKIWKNH